ncbi:MAG: hypothetical protein PHO41_04055 [Eubacteriales bacterium]|nr:hypothetical protein [Eubacteriales bacterium]
MKSIILYYSFQGHTKKIAEKMAHTLGADLVEVQTKRHQSLVGAYLVETLRAHRRKVAPIKTVTQDLNGYDLITLAAPVWNSFPAPAFNAMVQLLPPHKNIQVIMVSAHGSGATEKSEEGTRKLIKKQGCTVVDYKDMHKSA